MIEQVCVVACLALEPVVAAAARTKPVLACLQ